MMHVQKISKLSNWSKLYSAIRDGYSLNTLY